MGIDRSKTGGLVAIWRAVKRRLFPGSRAYWERRYAGGGNSGASSFGQGAKFKARVVNEFIRKNRISSVVEFGCGDGNQLLLADYPRYTGLDVSQTAIKRCRALFKDDPTKRFLLYDGRSLKENDPRLKGELSLSLDVIFHLIEDELFESHLKHLFSVAKKFVIIYSTNIEFSDNLPAHIKHRKFTDWIVANQPEWKLLKKIPNQETESFCDFFIYQLDRPR
jgi:SAM-dependent methyltransferase